jgi:hypothetical protein
MSTELLPAPFWFRLALPCRRVDGIPRSGSRGALLDLPEPCSLAAPVRWEGREPFAEVRAGWNPQGLGISVTVRGKTGPIRRNAHEPDYRDGVHQWIDTRDTRDIHRATRYCHRFAALLEASAGRELAVGLSQKPIPRALADAPKARPEDIQRRAERRPDGWRIELFFAAEALHGFDPETNRRLGLLVQVVEPTQGEQVLGAGREFPAEADPSLWTTLELRDEPA